MADEQKERMTVHIPISLKREVEQRADTAGQSLSVWVERALSGFLEKAKA